MKGGMEGGKEERGTVCCQSILDFGVPSLCMEVFIESMCIWFSFNKNNFFSHIFK